MMVGAGFDGSLLVNSTDWSLFGWYFNSALQLLAFIVCAFTGLRQERSCTSKRAAAEWLSSFQVGAGGSSLSQNVIAA